MSLEGKAVCITHGDDVDGLVCAVYLANLRMASTILVNYDELEGALRKIQPPVKEVYLCDLNIRDAVCPEIVEIAAFAKTTIIDHHPTAEDILGNLQRAGVALIHNTNDCASVLLSDHFRGELTHEELRLAAYAAISDQFEEGPLASRLLSEFDKQLVQHEALILTHALAKEHSMPFKLAVIEELKKCIPPHSIDRVAEAALSYLDTATEIVRLLPKEAVKLGKLAYIESKERVSTGTMANLLLDALDIDVGVSYKTVGADVLNISVRGRRGFGTHLGDTTRQLAQKYGGFGGGHKLASGASIPAGKLRKFLLSFEEELAQR